MTQRAIHITFPNRTALEPTQTADAFISQESGPTKPSEPKRISPPRSSFYNHGVQSLISPVKQIILRKRESQQQVNPGQNMTSSNDMMPKYSEALNENTVKLFIRSYNLWGNMKGLSESSKKFFFPLCFVNSEASNWFLLNTSLQ
ncbi:unnamed protein product [Orchesella dallaii]|uniref:Uncharacterized protein n=1 Tax=Orchesella dallaii TaxID=48710 RepID=A0ABP1RU94_9HEXA